MSTELMAFAPVVGVNASGQRLYLNACLRRGISTVANWHFSLRKKPRFRLIFDVFSKAFIATKTKSFASGHFVAFSRQFGSEICILEFGTKL